MTQLRPSPLSAGIIVLLMIAVGVNLRPPLSSLGPMLDQIQAHTGLSGRNVSLLTTLPIALMGMGAFFAAYIRRILGEYIGILMGLSLIGLAFAQRYYGHNASGLMSSAVFAGIGISIAQTLLPSFIKHHSREDMGRMMGIYTTIIMGGAALGGFLTPIYAQIMAWNHALAAWILLTLAALVLWGVIARITHEPARGFRPLPGPRLGAPGSLWRSPKAYLLGVFMGIGTGSFIILMAWLPAFYTHLGWSPLKAGALLGALTLAEVFSGLFISSFITHFPDRRVLIFAALISLGLGLAAMLIAPLALAWPAGILMGFGVGGLFPLSVILIMDHAHSPDEAARLNSFVQGWGYIIAALFPLFAGIIRDLTGDLHLAWIALGGITLLEAVITFYAARPHMRT
ncbi:MFS transporter [Woodsholea maritima]|uniref:MFS transporter n=1 Tax=Woodsholea maritima TaxID=240237 RepID=UPI0003741D65|nr:MFS transporter [Woodsholea maritima]